jgi:hypothetical protein
VSPHALDFSRTRALLFVAFLLIAAGAAASRGQSPQPQAAGDKSAKVDKEFYTAADRLAALHAATVFTPKAVAEADIAKGPKQKKDEFQFHFNDKVICDFNKPGKDMGGKTPKFACKITRVESTDGQVQTLTPQMDEEPMKVKYGADDNEVYAEVAATRLMWALGYLVDAWYPVHVECHNCPVDPEKGTGAADTRTFTAATVVRKFDGHKMYQEGKPEEGWSWKELDQDSGRPTYERDGLKLIGAFIQHSDNKPPQQRLVCEGVQVNQSTQPFKTTCKESFLVVQDVGATFGGGGLFTSNTGAKVNLEKWSSTKLWIKAGTPAMSEADCPVCKARLRNSLTAKDGLHDPTISEEGRRLAAGLMCQLTDSQIEDLFKTARVAEMPKYHNKDGSFKQGVDEATVVKEWVTAFKEKREAMANARCRWKEKPTDLKLIDNPAGLSSVPNYCTAHPY